MPKTPSNKLFKLIKSLNGSEKRYFKLYSNNRGDNKANKYTRLFDAIDAQEVYDEEALKRMIYDDALIQSRKFSELKAYLYELILKSLQSYDEKLSVDYKLKGLLQSVRVLFKRSHYNECKELLQKAKTTAEKYEHFISLLEISRWEKKIAYAQIDVAFLDKEMGRIGTEEKSYLMKLRNLSNLKNIFFRILIFIRKHAHARSEEKMETLQQVINDPLLTDIENAKSYKAKLLYYRIYALYYSSVFRWEAYYQTSKNLLALLDSRPEIIKEYVSEYIAALNNLSMSAGILKKYDEVEVCLKKFKQIQPVTYDDELKTHMQYYQNKFSLCIATGQFEDGLEALQQHLHEIEKFDPRSFQRNVFYYNYFYIYFGIDNYGMALEYLNKWLSLPRSIERQDLQSIARTLNLVIHYEMGNKLLLEGLIRNTRRFQQKQDQLFKFEKILLQFIKEANRIMPEKELQEAFIKLKEESVEISRTPSESIIFKSFNFIAWIDSKIYNKPFSIVVKEQFKSG